MNHPKYALLLLLLVAVHLFLSSYLLILAWGGLGVALALGFHQYLRPLRTVLLMEAGVSVVLFLYTYGNNTHLGTLAQNSSLPFPVWIAAIITINALTALLCISTGYTMTRLFHHSTTVKN
ncbi:MAG TPA: hypothetical protein VF646_01010 [Cytophagales bacterium]|jgi:hypothetical protein